MGEIRLSVGQINITDYLIINIREVDNPIPIVDFLVVPPPVPAVQNLLFSGLNDVVHYVDFRDSVDGIDPGTLLATYVYDVATGTLIAERRFYTVGGPGTYDPLVGGTTITDPYFVDKSVYGVFKEGFRFLKPSSEWTIAGDTITLLVGGEFFVDEVISVEINFTVNQSAQSAKQFPDDVIAITVNTTLNTTHYKKLLEINSGATILTLTTPDIITIPDKTMFGINTDNGTQRYCTLVITNGYMLIGGVQRTSVYIGRGEELVFIKKGGYFRVLSWSPGNHARVGAIELGDAAPLNSVPETGGWKAIADYPRLFYWFVNILDPSLLGTGTSPTTPSGSNAQKWCIDAVNGMLWVPDTGGWFMRNTDPNGDIDFDRSVVDRKPGTTQGAQVGEFVITYPKGNSYTGNPNVLRFGNGAANPQDFNVTYNSGDETRPVNINRNVYRII